MQDLMAMGDQIMKNVGKVEEDILRVKGSFEMHHIRDGKIIDKKLINNVITNAGLAEVAGLIVTDQAAALTAFDYIAIGTGTTGASTADTALVAEITTSGGARTGTTGTRTNTTVTNDTGQWVATFNFIGTFAVTESGIFNKSSTGDMLCRQTFSAINVASGDSLQVTWKVACS